MTGKFVNQVASSYYSNILFYVQLRKQTLVASLAFSLALVHLHSGLLVIGQLEAQCSNKA